MSNEFTPTTKAFNRWLERVKAEAQVEALREAARSRMARRYESHSWLNDRADRIAREAGIEIGESNG